jgi:hypothetical protein
VNAMRARYSGNNATLHGIRLVGGQMLGRMKMEEPA